MAAFYSISKLLTLLSLLIQIGHHFEECDGICKDFSRDSDSLGNFSEMFFEPECIKNLRRNWMVLWAETSKLQEVSDCWRFHTIVKLSYWLFLIWPHQDAFGEVNASSARLSSGPQLWISSPVLRKSFRWWIRPVPDD